MERDESAINVNDLTPEARERYFRNEIATAVNRAEIDRPSLPLSKKNFSPARRLFEYESKF